MKPVKKVIFMLSVIWLTALIPLSFIYFSRNKPENESNIEILETKIDSLKKVLESAYKLDTVYKTKYISIKVKGDSIKEKVERLPIDSQLIFFSDKTGNDSVALLKDSSIKVTAMAIKKANLLFIDAENFKVRTNYLEKFILFKDSLISYQKQIISEQDSLSIIKDRKHFAETRELKSKIKQKNIITSVAIVGFLISIFK